MTLGRDDLAHFFRAVAFARRDAATVRRQFPDHARKVREDVTRRRLADGGAV